MRITELIEKIVSGGQTGVDRAALDVAIKLGVPHGGWCPKGRLSESGEIPENYLLKETPNSEYSQRTILNIRDSSGTLVIRPDENTEITDGTNLTEKTAFELSKPIMIIYLSEAETIDANVIAQWIIDNKITILNVAGPRESQSIGIYQRSCNFLEEIFNKPLLIDQNPSSFRARL